ncbi:DNA polymerase III subunit alpha [Alicyclobacillus acidiphilus]|uniref:DNA polymerase III subunit alpha n=1 Tax=Alicyclobacillus acidiphilus TaxID=182455 RepID=UPI00082E2E23|nr:DNA polymerase III subunit alpha [Alicyclobacillus acidiphilus]
MSNFVHLHVHSAYSFRESVLRIEELVEAAVAHEMRAVALTDIDSMYGAIGFYRLAKERNLQPILGVQCSVLHTEDGKRPVTREEWRKRLDPVVLLGKGDDGYRALTRLVSACKAKGHVPYLTLDDLAQHAQHVICLFGGGESHLLEQFAVGETEAAMASCQRLLAVCRPGQIYVDVQDHRHPLERQGLPGLLRAANDLGIPLAATNDVRYRGPEAAELHRLYAQLTYSDAQERWPNDSYGLVSAEEMRKRFASLPSAADNTLVIAEQCQAKVPLHQVRMPKYETKDGRPADAVLRDAAMAGAKSRYARWTDEIERRLAYELDVICEMGYADYFLVVADFIRFAHQQGISTGPGRGSAAGSLVAYALRITDVDPVANRLLFERFLNPARVSLPDIDTDFEYERRGEVIAYVVEKYGKERVAQIGTFGTLAARAALREAGRMLQAEPRLVDQLAKLIPGQPGTTLSSAKAEVAALANLVANDSAAQRLFETALQLEGLPHHTSIHAAGVVIAPDDLADCVPLDVGADGTPITQYAMDDVEALGLVKMDFLGLKTLTLIDHCVRSVKERTGSVIDWRRIPVDDKATYEMLARAETGGVFQLDSPGMRRVLKQLRPTTLDDIVAVNALNRPGPMENIPAFCDAKHGKVPVRYPHAALEPILKDTYGVIVYQEQIMQIASLMAGFTLGQADLLRRAVSKKKREVLDEERTRFVEGALACGYDADTANEVYDLIVRFADYGFNRSHAAAYAVLSYRTAYLRAHYLPDFLAALLTMDMGSPDKVKSYTEDAKRHRILVRPPCVVASGRGYAVEEDGSIRTGLLAVRNVGEAAVENILSTRREKPFSSLRDFAVRVNSRVVNRKAMEGLLEAGAFDVFFPDASAPSAKYQMFEETMRQAEEAKQFEGLGLGLSLDGPSRRNSVSEAGVGSRSSVLYVRYRRAKDSGKEMLTRVQEVLAMNTGDVPVALHDEAARKTRLLSDKWRVTLTPELITMLEDIVGIGNVKVKSST